jgi:riboflavin synthase
MFTGLVQDVGRVASISAAGGAVHLRVETRLAPELAVGDSLAVNGACLTVTSHDAGAAVATAVPETLDRTNLGALRVGDRVNLEPALRLGDRLGGHLVQGHVDGLATLRGARRRGPSLELTLEAGAVVLRYVVEKGSVALDGVSLTVAALAEDAFTVAIVPHTLGATTLESRGPGDRINVEVDLLAKYVERMLATWGAGSPRPAGGAGTGLTEAWLREKGF